MRLSPANPFFTTCKTEAIPHEATFSQGHGNHHDNYVEVFLFLILAVPSFFSYEGAFDDNTV